MSPFAAGFELAAQPVIKPDDLFGRTASLTIWSAKPDAFFTIASNAIVVDELRFTFTITKSLGKEPNKCDAVIYNLSEATRHELENKPLIARLEAGYAGKTARLFEGDLRWAMSEIDGTDWQTKLQIADGDRAINYGRASRTHAPGVSVLTVAKEAAASMGITFPTSFAGAKGMLDQFASGAVLQGPSHLEMDRLLKPRGLTWSIQDGQMSVFDDSDRTPRGAIVVDEATGGMVGSPSYGPPGKKGEAPVLTVKMLLRAEAKCGGQMDVRAREVQGVFKIKKVTHTGDNFGTGQDWITTCEGTAL